MAKGKPRVKVSFDLTFEEIVEWDESIDIFDVIPMHMDKKYSFKVKPENIMVDEVILIDEFNLPYVEETEEDE